MSEIQDMLLYSKHYKDSYMLENKYKVITFDLDDTLWQCQPLIERAELKLRKWLQHYYPKITECFSYEAFKSLRNDIIEKHPKFSHDFNRIRKTMLSTVALESGYNQTIANKITADGFKIFIKERSNVILYDDVLPALTTLAKHYTLGALTNGNVDLKQTQLNKLFNFSLNAITAGISKPDIRFYRQACQLAKSAAIDMLHIGDNPIDDIQGAKQAGYHTIWINRDNLNWPDIAKPNNVISSLAELPKLLLNH